MERIILTATHSDISTVLGNSLVILVSFLILLFILSKIAFNPLMTIVEKRETEINTQMTHAKELEQKAQSHEEIAKETIQQAKEKAKDLVTKAKEASEKIQSDASKESRLEAIRIRQEAEIAIEHERQAAMAALTSQVADMSIELTKKILKRELTAEDHQQLIDEFIEGLES